MDYAAAQPAGLDLGRVIGGTAGVLKRNWVAVLTMSGMLIGIPWIVLGLLGLVTSGGPVGVGLQFGAFLVGIAVLVFSILTTNLLTASLVHLVLADLNGSTVRVADSLASGFRYVLPLFGLAILQGLGVGLAALLFLIPGLILMTVWSVAAPALIAERIGVFEAFGRSARLTQNNRWPVFGLMILAFVLFMVVSLIVEMPVTVLPFGVHKVVSGLILTPISRTVISAVQAAGLAVLYFELRRIREGALPSSLAGAFD